MRGRFDSAKQKLSPRIAAGCLCLALFSEGTLAATFSLNYSGRLTRSDGSPLEGPVVIQAKFWNAVTDGTQLGQTFEVPAVNLSVGVFTLELSFTADQVAAIFGDGSAPVYIEIVSENKIYPRQQFSYVPFALRVPVDPKTLAFDADGKLSLSLTTKPATNQFLTKDSDGKLIWGTPAAATIQNQAIATGTPSSGQVLTYNGSQWTASNPVVGNGSGSALSGVVVTRDATETLTNKTITAATINGSSTVGGSTVINTTGTFASGAATVNGPVTLRGNGTSANKLILNDKGSTNSLSLKAPDTLASSVTWELPPTDGSSGQVLATNGSGVLNWTSGLAPVGNAGGDLTGAFPNPTLVNVGTAGAYSKVVVDSKGRVISGNSLTAADIPNLSASQITSGTFNSAQLPTAGTAGTYAKVTTDAYGRVTAGSTLSSADIPPISASLITSGTLNTAQLPTAGTAGTYVKVTTDAYGRVTAGTTLASSDVTSSLGFTPLNKAGDTMGGALNHGGTDIANTGNIQMAASKTLALSANAADPSGLTSGDVGKTWFNTTNNQIKYWDGSTAVALGVAGSGLSSFNGQTGNTQTLATPGTTGTAPAWSSASNAHTLNIPLASTASVTAGLISNSDYNTFNGKVAGVTAGTGVSVSTTGNIATVNLATAGTAGTYAKVTTDAYGRVTAGTTLVSSDVTSSLGFTPLNKAGDTMSGPLTLPSNGLTVGTNQFVLANANVGIGTTAPAGKLDVAGSICLSSANCISSWPTGSVTSVTAGTGLTGGPITSAGSLSLANTSVTAGAYSRANITVDAQGRLTAAANGSNVSLTTEVGGVLPIANGGTGAANAANAFNALSPLTTLGDLLYGGASGAGTRLAGNTTTSKQFLTSVGSGSDATAPAWGPLAASDIPAHSAALITSGTLSVANGGTGASTLAANNVLLGNGTSAPLTVAPGASGNVLTSDGTTWTSSAAASNWTTSGANVYRSSGNVGIGTTSPGDLMHIYGSGTGANLGYISQNGTRQWRAGVRGDTSSSYAIQDDTAGAMRLVINGSGNIGIGTSSPAGKLDVAGSICLNGANCITSWPSAGGYWATSGGNSYVASGNLGVGTASPAADLSFGGTLARTIQVDRNTGAGTNGGGLTLQAGGALSGGSNYNGGTLTLASGVATGTGTSAIEFKTASAGTSGAVDSAPTTKMTILGNGNVGIGTTAPGAKFDIGGSGESIRLSGGAAQTFMTFLNGSTRKGYVGTGAGGTDMIFNVDSGSIVLQGGNVGIGTTAPIGTLDVGTAGSICLGGSCKTAWPASGNQWTTVGNDIYKNNAGNVGIGTTAPAAASLHIWGHGTTSGWTLGNLYIGDNTSYGVGSQSDTASSGIIGFAGGGANLGFLAYYPRRTDNLSYFRMTGESSAFGDNPVGLLLDGRVGIGTTAPQTLLQVYGSGGVANLSAETGMLKVTNSSANELSIGTNPASPYEGWLQVKRTNNSGNWYPLALQPAGGNVGIGTTSPLLTAHVLGVEGAESGTATPSGSLMVGGQTGGAATAMALTMGVIGGGSNYSWLQSRNRGAASFYNLALNPSGGNVGIGTTIPGYKFDVATSGTGMQTAERLQNTVAAANSSGAQTVYAANRTTTGLTDVAGIGGIITDISQSAYKGALVLSTANNAAPAERMRIDSSGNVGIGTTAPTANLHIYSSNSSWPNLVVQSTNSTAQETLGVQNDAGTITQIGAFGSTKAAWGIIGTGESYLYSNAGALDIGVDNAAGVLKFATGGMGNERMRISATGNVGIGTTAPTTMLDLEDTSGTYTAGVWPWPTATITLGGRWYSQSSTPVASGGIRGWHTYSDGSYGGGVQLLYTQASSSTLTPGLTLQHQGYVGIGTTTPSYTLHVNGSVAGVGSYVALSDIRYKKNIQDLADSLAKVLAIRGVSYNWMDEKTYGSDTQFGVIAQEIERIVPEVVTTGSDGVKRVRYSDLIPLVIEALKAEKISKDAEIARLKAESAQLKARADRAEVESAQLKAALCHKFPDLPVCGQ